MSFGQKGSDLIWCVQAINLGSAMTAHPHIVYGEAPGDKRLVTWRWRRCAAYELLLASSVSGSVTASVMCFAHHLPPAMVSLHIPERTFVG